MPFKDKNKQRESRRRRYYLDPKKERIRAKKRRDLITLWFREYKSTLSCDCGEKDSDCLDFHHEGQKDKDISTMVRTGYSKNRILKEIEKCVVKCANCHRKLHASERKLTT